MKAAPFDYVRADSLDHALDLLSRHGGDAKLIAGGQSLVPMMAMRLVRPTLLIDIYRLPELQTLNDASDRFVTGAAVRQCWLERDESLSQRLPLVAQALRWVGHEQTRNRGTVGGSLVHADPSAELPLAAAVLDGALQLRSAQTNRYVAAGEFFLGPMMTAIRETECLVAVEWPRWSGGRVGGAFEEFAIRHGDFALASAAAQVQMGPDGVCARAVLGVGGADAVPLALPRLAERLIGARPTDDLIRSIAADAARACNPGSDIHASAAYRRHLVNVLVERALRRAFTAAGMGNE